MPVMTVLLLPTPFGDAHWDNAEAELRRLGHDVRVVSGAEPQPPYARRWVATIARATESVTSPIVFVATGSAGPLIPMLGVAQRAQRRRTLGYAFVDAALPRAAGTLGDLFPNLADGGEESLRVPTDWPDAPCAYVATGTSAAPETPDARLARLRGWPVRTAPDAPTAVLDALSSLLPAG